MAETVRRKVTVRVPATTANLGSGYDSIGMAVDLWNELTVEHASEFSIHIEGEGSDKIPRNSTNLVVKGVELAFRLADQPVPTLAYTCRNGIPYGSGLGSSSAAIVSGLLAGLVLAGKELQVSGQEEMLQAAAQLEGHIDNLSPTIYGGIQVGVHDGTRWSTTGLPVPSGMQCVVLTPNTPMNTQEARQMLPDKITRSDAIFNIGRSSLLVYALMSRDFDALKLATQDRLHQPIRGGDKVMPALYPVIQAALDEGAKGCFLSGAGSSIMALTVGARGEVFTQAKAERRDQAVAAAMKAAAKQHGVEGKVRITKPTTVGAHVVSVTETHVKGTGLGQGLKYVSTRAAVGEPSVTFEQAVMNGLAPDGGLYVPHEVPKLDADTIASWRGLTFQQLAVKVMSQFIGHNEIPTGTLTSLVERSYATFTSAHVTPLIKLDSSGQAYLLEQFHGPTCAFKDVALQFVGNLFEFFLQRRNADGENHKITVLGATSGDTGSAAIFGLRNKANVEVYILHPKGRVAPIQEAQMTTVLDENVHNVSVEGAFDDCQAMVKACFNNKEFRDRHNLAAVNSINWARILAQIVYYFYAYFRFLDMHEADYGTPLKFVVPTGNFGNALAGFYARCMGLPIDKLVVATNRNDILSRFFQHGDYSARPVQPSLAPAMDIVVPSNFERFLYVLLGNDSLKCREAMHEINTEGLLRFGAQHDSIMAQARAIFQAGRASDQEIETCISQYERQEQYLLCPHTAAGVHVMNTLQESGPFVCFATAHPAKFGNALEKTRIMQPRLPAQLDGTCPIELEHHSFNFTCHSHCAMLIGCGAGLLDRQKRCAHINNDLSELQTLLDHERQDRSLKGLQTLTSNQPALQGSLQHAAHLCRLGIRHWRVRHAEHATCTHRISGYHRCACRLYV
eukprot:TRINITY_DN12316_c0_g1_i6.p1 TRINITY_DN12316_c0_g1~~TRINITY_DN12316_c0_g1_i6.p1  ORF type:complete len:943 (+),score=233.23 TRINITY_DN12316_c0_g1_i6:115-2829(+)